MFFWRRERRRFVWPCAQMPRGCPCAGACLVAGKSRRSGPLEVAAVLLTDSYFCFISDSPRGALG